MLLVVLLNLQSTTSSDGTGAVCCGAIILIIIIAVLIGNSTIKQRTQVYNSARDNYYLSLARLKENPTDPDLRQATLAFGRTYSNLTRNNKGVTIFDEVALSNDINAACGGATRLANEKPTSHTQTIESRLQKLTDLKNGGLISEEEYAARRQKILDDV